jgi:predicted  nucleic acid-binding Zn-ribbon protein
MEVKYDETAVLDYISNFRNLQDLMKRDMDESLNKYNACKQEYSRIFTECEEESHRAYNRVMSADSEIQMADMMLDQAMASVSDSDDEDSQPDYDMINRAQEMRRQAEADLVGAQADYSRAQDNIRKLNAIMEKYGPTLEAESKVVNDSFTECSLVGSKASEALEQYVGVMDKAYSALYESPAPQSSYGASGSSSSSGSNGSTMEETNGSGGNSTTIVNEMTSSGDNKGVMSKQTISGIDVANASGGLSSVQGAIGSTTGGISGQSSAQMGKGAGMSGAGTFVAGALTIGIVSYMIAGQKREFSNDKVGLNQAYKAAIKANDRGVAGEILHAFKNIENKPLTDAHKIDATSMYKSKLADIDAYIENYREALLARGVPEGEWLKSTLAIHKAKMMEQAGYEIDSLTGHRLDSTNNPNAYIYPGDNQWSEFYDNLAAEYREYSKFHNDVIQGKNIVDTFVFDSSSGIRAGQQVAEYQGYTGKPLVVDEKNFDMYASKSGIVGFRTFSSGTDIITNESKESTYFAQELRSGEQFSLNGNGRQVYGEGTYFAINHNPKKGILPSSQSVDAAFDDSRYYGNGDDISTVKMTVRDDMVIKKYEDVLEDFVKLEKTQQLRFGGRGREGVAAYAIATGVDALVHEYWDLDYLIVYNRTKLIVLEKNI